METQALTAQKARSLAARWKSAVEKHEKKVEQVGRTLMVGGTAFAAGFIAGRFEDKFNFGGVPFELYGAGAALAVSFLGSSKTADTAANIADGFAAAYMTNLGKTVGIAARVKAASSGDGE